MMTLQITLKSGAQVTADIADSADGGIALKTTRSGLTGDLNGIEWNTPGGWLRKLHHIDIDQVAAIVIIRDPVGGEIVGLDVPAVGS